MTGGGEWAARCRPRGHGCWWGDSSPAGGVGRRGAGGGVLSGCCPGWLGGGGGAQLARGLGGRWGGGAAGCGGTAARCSGCGCWGRGAVLARGRGGALKGEPVGDWCLGEAAATHDDGPRRSGQTISGLGMPCAALGLAERGSSRGSWPWTKLRHLCPDTVQMSQPDWGEGTYCDGPPAETCGGRCLRSRTGWSWRKRHSPPFLCGGRRRWCHG